MKLVIVSFLYAWFISACDSDLRIEVANEAVAPSVFMGKSEDGYGAAFIPEIDEISADAVSYQWEKVEGPGNVFFDEPTSRNPTIHADLPGAYVVKITVANKRGMSSSALYDFFGQCSPFIQHHQCGK